MSEHEKIQGIDEVDKTSKTKHVSPEEMLTDDALAAEKEKFQSLMSPENSEATQFKKVDNRWEIDSPDKTHFESQKKEITATNTTERLDVKKNSDSKVDSVGGVDNSGHSIAEVASELKGEIKGIAGGSPEEIQAKSKEIIGKLESLKKQLAENKGEIKPSYHKVLEHRLSHIDDSLKVALNKIGGEYNAPSETNRAKNPIERFIEMATHGQHQLNNIDKTITDLQMGGGTLSPANMMVLQIKVNQISQEVELFTALLNKALEATKSIMSVQV